MIEDIAWIGYKKEELTELLKFLPEKHYLRDRAQEAGKNIFRW
jgi:hypothetical protein